MSCNNVHILNFNHNVVEIGSDNKLIITDNVKCNSITIPQPVTNILQINSPGPQGPAGANPSGPNNSLQFKSGSFLSGSSKLTFDPSTNTLTLTGSMDITGSLTVNTINVGQNTLNFIDDNGNFKNSFSVTGNNIVIATGSLITSGSAFFSGSFVGPLQGTASWATNTITASFLPIGTYNITSSWAVSASQAITSSYVSTLRATGSNSEIQYNDNGVLGASSNFRYGISNINIGSTILGSRDIISSDEIGVSGDSDQIIALHNPNTLTYHYSSGKYKYDDINNIHSFTGSLGVTAGLTGSLQGTASWAHSSSISVSSSYATTASYALFAANGGGTTVDTGSFVTTSSFNAFTASYNTGSFTGSFIGSLQGTASWAVNFVSASNYVLTSATSSMLAPYLLSSQTSSFLTTGSINTTQTISGSLVIDQNLTVLGTQSIQYITSSQLNISTNIITVNTSTPAIRFGGLAVYDSGSLATGLTGSLLWDSQNDQWIYSNPSGSNYDGAVFLVGPRNTTGLGSEVGINEWYAAIGNGDHHITSSQIYNSGSLIRLETNTQVTGSLNISNGITGSLQGTASWATNFVSASNYVLTSTTSSMLAPYLLTSQTSSMLTPYLLSSQTSSFITNTQTSSFVTNAQTSSMLAPYLLSSQTSSMTVATASYISPTFISASAAASGFGSGGSVDTGSLLVTASASSNVITFTKGDGTPFNITVATGSGGSSVDTSIFVTTSSFNSWTGSSSSQFAGTASYATTASYAMNGGGGGGGITQGQVVAIVTGYSNLF